MTTNGDVCHIANIYILFVSGESKSVGYKHKSWKLLCPCCGHRHLCSVGETSTKMSKVQVRIGSTGLYQ